jgi:hypothetical protein
MTNQYHQILASQLETFMQKREEEINNLAERYASEDIGKLYSLIHTVNSDNLTAIKIAGINLGHADLLFQTYHELNMRELRVAGADEKSVREYNYLQNTALPQKEKEEEEKNYQARLQETCKQCLERIRCMTEKFNVQLRGPTQKELLFTLLNSAQTRGPTIENLDSSTGKSYQLLFWQDYNHVIFHVKSEDKEKEIPYHKLHPVQRGHLLIQHHLRECGILKPTKSNIRIEFKKPETENQ